MANRTSAKVRVTIGLQLTAKGHPPMPDWWVKQLDRFDTHASARTLVARVGRGGVKSTTSTRFAIAELLTGKWKVPPGERHYFAFVSVSVGEAIQRLAQCTAQLDALGVKYKRLQSEIELKDAPLGIRVFSAAVGAVSGFRCIGFVADEIAKWRFSDSSANPAREVISSLRAMCVTHPDARALIVSSPWSEADHHAELMGIGDNESQLVCESPTWIANPSITEAETRKLETDPRVWAREYAAIPQASSSPAFETLDECIDQGIKQREYSPSNKYGLVFDLGGRKSGFGGMVFHFEFIQPEEGRSVQRTLIVDDVVSMVPTFLRRVSFQRQMDAVVELATKYRLKRALCDQHEYDAASESLQQRGITTQKLSMSVADQSRRSARYAGRIRSGAVGLLDHDDLISQHREAVSVERTNGFIIKSPGRGIRDDLLDCCLLANDENFDRLPAGGGEIKYKAPRVICTGGHISVNEEHSGYYRETADGQRLPVAMPKQDPRHETARRGRWANGVFTPEDIIEFGDVLLAHVHEELSHN